MNSSVKKWIVVLMVVICFVMQAAYGAEKEKKEGKNFTGCYSLEGVTSLGKKGAAEWKEVAVLLIKKINEKSGMNINPVVLPRWKDVIKKIRTAKIDFALIPAINYVRLKKSGFNIKSVAVITHGASAKYCIYTNSNKGIESLNDLRGKKLSVSQSYIKRFEEFPSPDLDQRCFQEFMILDMILLRKWLDDYGKVGIKDSGIGLIIDYPNIDSELIALDRGMIDAAISDSATVDVYNWSGKPFKNIKELICMDVKYLVVVAASNKVPETAIETFKRVVEDLSLNPDEELRNILRRFDASVGEPGMYPITDDDIQHWFRFLDEAEESRWIEEAEKVAKDLIEEANKKK